MPYIDVVQPEDAQGALKEIYDDLIQSRGKIAEVHKIQSLNPESIVKHMDLYMTVMFGRSPIKRYQREMMAVVVSKANNCAYCQTHHAEAVQHYWKDAEKVQQLRDDWTQLELSDVDRALCQMAWELTKDPALSQDGYFAKMLRKVGLEDRAILDGALVIAYFNFVNRIVLGLGVDLETNAGGYKY